MPILQPFLDLTGRALGNTVDDHDSLYRRAAASNSSRWGVVLDAGSSGTRLHIYKWENPVQTAKNASLTAAELHTLPKLTTDKSWTQITRPGVSSYGANPTKVGDSLKGLVDNALKIIPQDQIKNTPIYLLATAGMRLLPATQQQAIQKEICTYLKTTGFSIPVCTSQIQVIDGETEGIYGWIATNYLAGAFDKPKANDHGKGHNTYGFLDMGGASAQITFIPNKTETAQHAGNKSLKTLRIRTLDGQQSEHKVFSKTWLGFGVNQAFESHVKKLVGTIDPKTTKQIPNPCAPKGLLTTTSGELANSTTKGLTLLGTGNFTGCLTHTKSLLGPCKTPQACLLSAQEPAIDFDVNHFLGVSEFYYSTHGVLFNSTKGNKAYDLQTYQTQVEKLCTSDWQSIVSKAKTPREKRASQWACYKSSWLINVLHDGLGVPRVDNTPNTKTEKGAYLDAFQPVSNIGGVEVSWTLGPMVLYASGQVPSNGSLPVGLEMSAPKNSSSLAGVKRMVNDIWVDHAKPSQNVCPIIFFIILALLLVGFIFKKTERRMPFMSKSGSASKTQGLTKLTNELLAKPATSHERIIQEGDAQRISPFL